MNTLVNGIGMTSQRTRDRLVTRLREEGIRNPDVLDVIRKTPRHLFVDEALSSRAYEDTALPIGYNQTISQPYVVAAGVNPILLGTLVPLQAAIGSATPPFGCDIFTAQLIFRRPYLEVIGHALPFLLILILATIILIAFPQIALFLPNMALGG